MLAPCVDSSLKERRYCSPKRSVSPRRAKQTPTNVWKSTANEPTIKEPEGAEWCLENMSSTSSDSISPIVDTTATFQAVRSVDSLSGISQDSGCAVHDSVKDSSSSSVFSLKTSPKMLVTATVSSPTAKSSSSPLASIVRKFSPRKIMTANSKQELLTRKSPKRSLESKKQNGNTPLHSMSSLSTTNGGDSGVYGTTSSAYTSQEQLNESSCADGDSRCLTPNIPSTTTISNESNSINQSQSKSGGNSKSSNKYFRLPPPLQLLKKKRSCPSLYVANNLLINTDDCPTRQKPLTPTLTGNWLRNDTRSPESAKTCEKQHSAFSFDAGMMISQAPVNQSSARTAKSPSCPSFLCTLPQMGGRYKLLKETAPTPVCRLQHERSMFAKLASSKLLRRWETHTMTLDSDVIRATQNGTGFMEQSIKYSEIEDVQIVPQFDSGDRFCLRLYVTEGSILLQAPHVYGRYQWFYSIQWHRSMIRYRKLLKDTNRTELVLKEIMTMVEMTKESALQDDLIFNEPVSIVCIVLRKILAGVLPRTLMEPVISQVSPLLETVAAVADICPIFSEICHSTPRCRLVDEVFANVAHETLKKNMDFGKFPAARTFVQDFFMALLAHNDGMERVIQFVKRVHSTSSVCAHARVMPNLVSVSLASIHAAFELPPSTIPERLRVTPRNQPFDENMLHCFCAVFDTMSQFDDWRTPLASLLQPLPFPERALQSALFTKAMSSLVRRFGTDARCDVHLCVLGVRTAKDGWFHLMCPGATSCADDGALYAAMLDTLLSCCCKRKKFLQSLTSMLGPLQLLALRENKAAMQALSFMLEMEVVEGEDLKLQMSTALQSTSAGRHQYTDLCNRQTALRELQQKGGPRKLTLPSKSTDADLAVLLSSGSFGNLEWLSLAFTNVTSACAEYLIRLPSLRYLNLWSTQFTDLGLQLISEHLQRLQVLNLCETPVTDKGISCLASLKNLRKLNLNSTRLSDETFQLLRENLPALQEIDVRYTDAWCADVIVFGAGNDGTVGGKGGKGSLLQRTASQSANGTPHRATSLPAAGSKQSSSAVALSALGYRTSSQRRRKNTSAAYL